MKEINKYYSDQLKKVSDINPKFSRQLQIKDNGKQTHWLSLNDESATEIVNWLKENYNIK